MSTTHEGWPARPAWADEEISTPFGNAPEGDDSTDWEVERRFLREVTVGTATARVEEFHVRQEGEEGAGLIDQVGPFVSLSPEDMSPEMARDALTALTRLLEQYDATA